MVFEDGIAGRAAVELLIEEGKLVPDFWLRVEAQGRDNSSPEEYDTLSQQITDVVQLAMGKSGVEPPEWASPTKGSPDYVWIDPEWRNRFPSTEPYYCPGDMYRAMKRCYDGSNLRHIDEKKLLDSYVSTSWRSWRRIMPYFSPELTETLVGIEQERGNNGHSFSKRYRIESMLSGAMIRDGALHEFYTRQGEEGLKHIFHGIGQKAILGVGAMLFLSGEHDELVYTAEALGDALSST